MSTQNSKKMENSKSNISNQDIYSIFQNSKNSYFNKIKKNTADYLQTVTNLQQELIESVEKYTKNTIDLQKDISEKFGMNANNSNNTVKLAESLGEQTPRSWNLQNQLILKSLKTFYKNIEAFNKNSEVFKIFNKNLVNSWASIIKETAKS